MSLLVGTIFANDSEDQRKWLDLQLRYLHATTINYDHVAVVMGSGENFKKDTTVIPCPDVTSGSSAHLLGLRLLLEYFRNTDKYQYFLILDSDAFPIRVNWLNDLLSKMIPQSAFGFSLKQKAFDIAVALRPENLEKRFHASILFITRPTLQFIDFEFGDLGEKGFMGRRETDVHLPLYQTEKYHSVFPLLRSNQNNVHPVACGVYYDMFYHHACGSRPFEFKSDNYWDFIPKYSEGFTSQLMTDPTNFIASLAGWNPVKYGKA